MSEEENDKSKIEQLKKSLYSRKGLHFDERVLDLKSHKISADEKWQEIPVDEQEEKERIENIPLEEAVNKSFTKKLLIGASIFFFLALLFTAYTVLIGKNLVSADKINISVVGPTTNPSGEEFTLDIGITNNNSTALKIADLLVEYPKGTRSAEDTSLLLQRERVSYGDINPGETVRKTIKGILFAEEGSEQKINYTFEYKIENATSVFTKEGFYEIRVASSPITLKVDSLREITSGQELPITLTVQSNSKEVIKGILLEAEYPFGFDVIGTDPKPIRGSVWDLGDIAPGGIKTIKINGKVIGERNEERFFRFKAGTRSEKNPDTIEAAFVSTNHAVALKKAFIGVAMKVDQVPSEQVILKTGEKRTAEILWVNNLTVPVSDVEIEARVLGSLLDKKEIESSTGLYRPSEDIIKWTKFEVEGLKEILPGEAGGVNFSFATLSGNTAEATDLRNQEIAVDINIKARRISESNVPETINSTLSRKFKIMTNALLSSRITRTTGPIENEGPFPPRLEQKTTYTVVWTIMNSLNNIEGARVTAVLPSYATWSNIKVPEAEKISFNANTREIVWELGKVPATGTLGKGLRQVAFQVGIVPPQNLLGSSPVVVNEATFTAVDSFTGVRLVDINKALTTSLPTDPGFKYGEDQVRE